MRKTVDPRATKPAEQVTDDTRRHRVDPLERLIQEQQVRVGQQCRGQRQLFLHAVRVFHGELLFFVLKVKDREQLVEPSGCGSSHGASDGCGRQMSGIHAQSGYRRDAGAPSGMTPILRLVLQRLSVIEHVPAQHAHLTTRGGQQAR